MIWKTFISVTIDTNMNYKKKVQRENGSLYPIVPIKV